MNFKKLALGVGAAAICLGAASAQAAYTSVNEPWLNTTEWNLSAVMAEVYGQGYSRINDSFDTTYAGTSGSVIVDAIYAGASQALFTAAAPSGSPLSTPILTHSGSTGMVPSRSGGSVSFTPVASPFYFVDIANGYSAYTEPGLSTGSIDRAVTYLVTGYLDNSDNFVLFSDGPHYVIGFEDGTDMDFNDLVVEVSGVQRVPDGATTMMLLGGALCGMGAIRRRLGL